MTDLPLSLTQDEVNFIMQVLGELQNKTGSYPILMKIQQQAQAAAITQAPVTPIPSISM